MDSLPLAVPGKDGLPRQPVLLQQVPVALMGSTRAHHIGPWQTALLASSKERL